MTKLSDASSGGWTFVFAPRFWFDETKAYAVGRDKVAILPDKGEVILNLHDDMMNDFREAAKKSHHLTEPKELDIEPEQGDHEALVSAFLHLNQTYNPHMESLSRGKRFQAFQYVLYADHVLTEVETRMRELRRSYRPVLVETSQPRGKILLRQSLAQLASGQPTLLCEVDEFELKNQHYSALMTVLEAIMDARPKDVSVLDKEYSELHRRANALRWSYREHAALPHHEARHVLESVRPSPNLMQWADLFRLSAGLLNPGVGTQPTSVRQPEQYPTHRIWEEILFKILELAFRDRRVLKQLEQVRPWNGSNAKPKNPDFFVQTDDCDFVLDAKYKDEARYVLSDDGYQLFAYGMLQAHNNTGLNERQVVRHVGFLLPGQSKEYSDAEKQGQEGESVVEWVGTWERTASIHNNGSFSLQNQKLVGLRVPFPTYAALNSDDDPYWRVTARDLRKTLFEGIGLDDPDLA